MYNRETTGSDILIGILALLTILIWVLVGISVARKFTAADISSYRVVAVASTGTYSTQTHFFCEEREWYFECDENGLGEELFFQPGERLVAATGRGPGDQVTFFCDVDGQVAECTATKLLEVQY